MVDFDRLKALGNDFLHKAGDLAEQAKEKAGPLAEQAKEKAGPLAEQAKEKAGPLAEKAKDAAAKGVNIAAERIDSATGGKYSERIDTVTDKLSGALGKDDAPGGTAAQAAADLGVPSADYAVDDAGTASPLSAQDAAEAFPPPDPTVGVSDPDSGVSDPADPVVQPATPGAEDPAIGTAPIAEHRPAGHHSTGDLSGGSTPTVDDPWDGTVKGS